jgi:hypothetical protein
VAKTYQDVVTEARVLLQDTDATSYRNSDTTLLAIYNRGLQSLARVRPDACYDLYSANSLNVPELVESGAGAGQTNWTDTFGLDMMFFAPLVSYIVGVAEIIDDEYSEDGRAALMLQSFKTEVMGI